MGISDYIAFFALVVSVLSSIFAWKAGNEAKKANEISLHFKKLEIYEEVISFTNCFHGLFNVPTAERLKTFQTSAVQRAEIYLSNEVFLRLQEIYTHCNTSEIWLSIAQGETRQGDGNMPSELEVRREYKLVLEMLYPVIQVIKTEARIAQ